MATSCWNCSCSHHMLLVHICGVVHVMEKRGIYKEICKPPEPTDWDEWGLLPKDHPHFKALMALQMTRAKDKELQPGYMDYLYAVAAMAIKRELEVHLMIPGPIGELPKAVALTFVPVPGSEFAKQGKPSITLICKLVYARPCWGTRGDCVCEKGVAYIMDCNNTALRWKSKVYALRLVKCYSNSRKPKHMVHVLGPNECLDQYISAPTV